MLAAAAAAAFALSLAPPAPASADSILTPTPTPCALPPPLTCDLASPLPQPASSPSPQPASTPPGSNPPPSSPSGPPPKAAGGGGGATGAVSHLDVQVLQSTLGNTALVAQLVSILQNPIGSQRPDLLHFQPAAQAAPGMPAKPREVVLTVLLLAVPILWMGGVPLLRLRPRAVAVAAVLAPAVLAACLVVPALAARPVAAIRIPRKPAAAPAVWRQLVAVERRLAGERRSLQQIESRLEGLTAALEAEQPVHGVQPHMFAALAAAHDADAAAYDQDLQREYQLYVAAAQQPAMSEELRQGAETAGMRSAAHAIDANLQTVQTQLQQEAVIADAQAKLQQLGFTPDQAKALQGHDAFVAPVGGPVAQPFGPTSFALEPPLVYQGTFYPHFHTGLDIEAPAGTAVAAAADGVVALVATSTDGHGHTTGYGTYIVVAHAHGYYTLYAHLSAVGVTAGQVVHQGQPIGLVGTTGNSTGPHLHFEIRRDGELLDPLPYVTGRLKPW